MNEVLPETPLPVTMNKTKVQELLRCFIKDKPVASMDTVVKAIGVSDIEPCRGVMRAFNTPLSELVHIEADLRMIIHTLYAVNCGASTVVILSNGTYVLVLELHYWNLLKSHGLKELWIRVVLGIQHDIFHFI